MRCGPITVGNCSMRLRITGSWSWITQRMAVRLSLVGPACGPTDRFCLRIVSAKAFAAARCPPPASENAITSFIILCKTIYYRNVVTAAWQS
jgi:hypothetical protein